MGYTEIINKAATDYCIEIDTDLDSYVLIKGFTAGINSPLAKQITEIEVVKGKIEENESMLQMAKLHMDDRAVMVLSQRIFTLEQLRDKLINELKLK